MISFNLIKVFIILIYFYPTEELIIDCNYLSMNSQDHFFYNEYFISGFNYFNELNITCKIISGKLIFVPIRPIVLDSLLNFKDIDTSGIAVIQYKNFIGFDLSQDLLKGITSSSVEVDIYYGIISFYLNKNLVNSECGILDSHRDINIFSSGLSYLVIRESKFLKNYCQLVFKNSFIQTLEVGIFSNSFFRQTYISFMDSNRTKISVNSLMKINSQIIIFRMLVYRLKLDDSILDKYVFFNTTNLLFIGLINHIQVDLFKNLKILNKIYFSKIAYHDFFGKKLIGGIILITILLLRTSATIL